MFLLLKEVKFSAPVLRISDVKPLREKTSTEWAQMIDVSHPVTDFHERIPDMAFKYDFELDTFQKQVSLNRDVIIVLKFFIIHFFFKF